MHVLTVIAVVRARGRCCSSWCSTRRAHVRAAPGRVDARDPRACSSACARSSTPSARAARTYDGRDSVMALYGPIGLLMLPGVWMLMVLGGVHRACSTRCGVRGFERAFEMSGSSLFTLGFVRPPDLATNVLAFLEAAIGLGAPRSPDRLPARPSTARSREREVQVAQLEIRAGNPPSGVQVLVGAQQMERFHLLDDFWRTWQQWFTELEETHTSLGVLSFFRSPVGHRSWVTASGAVLDAASLRLAAVDMPFDPEAGICVRGRVLRPPRRSPTTTASRTTPTRIRATRSASRKDEFLEACDAARRCGHAGARRPRGRVVRLHRLARELRRAAPRPRRLRDGAVRAVVVGPVVPRTATPRACVAAAAARRGALRRSRSRARRGSRRGG